MPFYSYNLASIKIHAYDDHHLFSKFLILQTNYRESTMFLCVYTCTCIHVLYFNVLYDSQDRMLRVNIDFMHYLAFDSRGIMFFGLCVFFSILYQLLKLKLQYLLFLSHFRMNMIKKN